MRAGLLNRRLRLQKSVTTVTADGFSIDAWTDVGMAWALIEHATAQEIMQAAQQEEKISHRLTLRYRSDVNNRMRARYLNRIFLFKTILDTEEAHKELICYCEEVVTGQVAA